MTVFFQNLPNSVLSTGLDVRYFFPLLTSLHVCNTGMYNIHLACRTNMCVVILTPWGGIRYEGHVGPECCKLPCDIMRTQRRCQHPKF